jgi:hypothetical protein
MVAESRTFKSAVMHDADCTPNAYEVQFESGTCQVLGLCFDLLLEPLCKNNMRCFRTFKLDAILHMEREYYMNTEEVADLFLTQFSHMIFTGTFEDEDRVGLLMLHMATGERYALQGLA